MSTHFFVAADHAHLRIFRQRQEPGQREVDLDEVQAMDFPAGRQSYTARDTSMAGRFQSSKHQSRAPGAPGGLEAGRSGMSIDERLPMQREEERRRARDLAEELNAFFAGQKDATWDLAIAPAMHHAVVELLSPKARDQLRRVIGKDLVNQGADAIRAHFTAGAAR
jgi:hypothetical protein